MVHTVFSSRVRSSVGLSTRQSVQASIAASPAGAHEIYPKGSIVICISCARPLYRLERSIFVGERAGRSADAYRPVRVADLVDLRAREDVDAGLRSSLRSLTTQQLQLLCDRIRPLRAGALFVCSLCDKPLLLARTTEVSETIDRAYVLELVTIPPAGHKTTVLSKGAVYARRRAGIRR